MDYYAIYAPSADQIDPEELVFKKKSDLLEVLKSYKDGRFKSFKTHSEALKFAKNGFSTQTLSIFDSIVKSPPPNTPPIRNMEKNIFPAPKSQDLVIFRKEIERNNLSKVYEMINTNPRYLVSSGDTPSILKEGARYNALHVAAISKHDKIAKLILQTVEQTKFIELLHGINSNNHPNVSEMSHVLLDSYLNTPDKARNETPLHFAAKFGAVDVVKVLVSYPLCKMKPNSDGMLPKEIVCSRMPDGPTKNDIKKEIEDVLEEKYFVPVLRSIDNSTQPIIGEPFTPSTMPNYKTDPKSPSLEIKAYAGPMSNEQAQTFRRRWKTPPRLTPTTVPSSLNLSFSPKSPRTSKSIPEVVSSTPKLKKKLIDTFNEIETSGNSSIMDELNGNHHGDIASEILSEREQDEFKEIFEDLLEDKMRLKAEQTVPLRDDLKGNFAGYRNPEPFLETPIRVKNDNNSNHLNHNFNGSLSELKFANSINDSMLCNGRSGSSTTAGFTYLDESGSMYNSDNVFDSPSFKEKNIRLTDIDKGLETIGRKLAIEYDVEWKEFWDFLNRHVDIRSADGLQAFETFLKQKEKQSELCESSSPVDSPIKKALNDSFGLGLICAGFNSLVLNEDKPRMFRNGLTSPTTNISKTSLLNSFQSSPQSFPLQNPFMCIEQSCRTFSRRLANLLESETVQDQNAYEKTLLKEINKLNMSIDSYKRDLRFNVVNFQKIHARYCYLLVSYIKENNVNVKYLRTHTPLMSKVYTLASQFAGCNEAKETTTSKTHAVCLSKFLKNYIEKQDKVYSANSVDTETSCVDAWNGPEINECNCLFDGSFTSSKHRRDIRKKLYNDVSTSILSSSSLSVDLWSHRSQLNDSQKSDDEDDDDAYISCSDDSSDEFFTPPQSPNHFDSDDDDSKNIFEESLDNFEDQKEFNLFIKGEKPTKIDDDVFNALTDEFDVDKGKYPLVSQWYHTMKIINSKKTNHSSLHFRIFTPKLKFMS